jgi:ribosome-binding protein aMBF1 (putative translation factor)
MAQHTVEPTRAFFQEFGQLLARRFADPPLDPSTSSTDRAARSLGRYLHTARTNRDLSQSQLATRAGVTEAKVVALEHGLIWPDEIERESLWAIAEVLGEDFEELILILGQSSHTVSHRL